MKQGIALLLAVAMMLMLVACAQTEDEPQTDPTTTAPTTPTTDNGEHDPNMDVDQDDEKIEISAGSTKMIYYHDGTNLTGYEMHIAYDTEDEAQRTYENLMATDTVGQTPGLDEIRCEGTILIYVYNEEAYGAISLDDVKSMAGIE